MDGSRMVRVATARDGFEARILAARLGAEGIVWELRGNVDGPYPVGEVQVLVEAEGADVARELLTFDADDIDGDDDQPAPLVRGGWVVVVALALVALMGLARILALL